jgi:hypothetical protein
MAQSLQGYYFQRSHRSISMKQDVLKRLDVFVQQLIDSHELWHNWSVNDDELIQLLGELEYKNDTVILMAV